MAKARKQSIISSSTMIRLKATNSVNHALQSTQLNISFEAYTIFSSYSVHKRKTNDEPNNTTPRNATQRARRKGKPQWHNG
jgi:hypothetical protein